MDFPMYPIIRDNWLERIDSMKDPLWTVTKEKFGKETKQLEDELLDFYEVKIADLVDAIKTIAFLKYLTVYLSSRMYFFQSKLANYESLYKTGLPQQFGGDPEPRLRVVK